MLGGMLARSRRPGVLVAPAIATAWHDRMRIAQEDVCEAGAWCVIPFEPEQGTVRITNDLAVASRRVSGPAD